MKTWNVPLLIVLATLGALVAVTLTSCAEQPEVTSETVEEMDEAAEETYLEPGEEPGQEVAPGVDVEQMTEETPPAVEEGGE